MAEINIEISNLAEIKSAFRKAPEQMVKELNTAIKKSVVLIGRGSRRNTPVDTGRLRASTYEKFSPLAGEVGTNTTYDAFVHEGTRFMRGRPYLAMAVQSASYDIDKFFIDAVENVLIKIGEST
ncbi:hypothetical protein UFOVP585_38 [uncultured Caudovirales phage]|uniref:Uncharacterized protein n=1 Tax=uncultured Caudovirales phage TaxID=2100421 RepID=A0A6J5MWZ9_9CAUD|nr:hypothetical protein UFOVP585_38 [uncultured Caudovirales phage]